MCLAMALVIMSSCIIPYICDHTGRPLPIHPPRSSLRLLGPRPYRARHWDCERYTSSSCRPFHQYRTRLRPTARATAIRSDYHWRQKKPTMIVISPGRVGGREKIRARTEVCVKGSANPTGIVCAYRPLRRAVTRRRRRRRPHRPC